MNNSNPDYIATFRRHAFLSASSGAPVTVGIFASAQQDGTLAALLILSKTLMFSRAHWKEKLK